MDGDTNKPFTLVIPEGDLVIKGSFDNYNAMFIVQDGSITFENQNCHDQDIVKGIFIAKNGFTTTADKNTDVNAEKRCE